MTHRPLRLLTVVRDLGIGGTQRAAENYTLGYAAAGIETAVLGYRSGGPREERLASAGVEVFAGPDGCAAAEAWQPTLVHVHRWGSADPESGSVLRRFRSGAHPPRVIETNVFGRVDYSPDRALIDVHLQLSRWCLWRWNRWARGLPDRPLATVVPYSVDPGRFAPVHPDERAAWRQAHGIPHDALLLGRIGQPIRWKWHPALFGAFREIAARHPRAHLLIVGLPDALRPALDALPRQARARVVELPILNGDEALRAAYGALDVFVHAAEIGETFGMVLAEAMLCEVPVVTLNRPVRDNSQLEVVGHGVGGFVAASEADMVTAIDRLLSSSELRTTLGRQGASRIADQFGSDVILPKLIGLAEKVVAASTRDDLRKSLTSAGLTTHISDEEIETLLLKQDGAMRRRDRWARDLLHQPFAYRLFQGVKRRLGE